MSRAALADDRPAAGDSTVGPEHAVTCYTTPHTPFKSASAWIWGNTTFSCNAAPDACYYYSELQIYDTHDKTFVKAAKTSSSNCGNMVPSTTLCAGYMCSSPYYSFTWRTKGHLEAFHGNWGYTTKYSSSVSLTC